jgi:ABC-type Fe3+ transport system substrate-binding protein
MSDEPRMTFFGKFIVLLFIAGCFYGAYYFFVQQNPAPPANGGSSTSSTAVNATTQQQANSQTNDPPATASVTVGIAYGTEKKRWLEWALEQFKQTPDGKRIRIDLIPLGSQEGARAVLDGDTRINVWSPASTLYEDVFVSEWQLKHGGKGIVRQEQLALTPMVFVFWEPRHAAFVTKYKEVSFTSVGQALKEKGGWDAIAQKPEWGFFKFGHTNPNQSNSGLMALVLMAYGFQNKTRDLTMKDILSVEYQTWMADFEKNVSGFSNSTGNMMRDMVLRGPSSYDALLVYENLAIDYLKNAEGRWGELRIAYPTNNMWNDNPYYIIDAPWSTTEQRKAAGVFLDYLLRDEIQTNALLVHGFRPGNPNVPVKSAESPFTLYAKYGLQIDLPTVCEPPKAEVITNLLLSWQRAAGNR